MKIKWFLLIYCVFPFFCSGTEPENKQKEWKKMSLDLYTAGNYDLSDLIAGAKLKMPFSEIRVYGNDGKWASGFSLFTDVISPVFPVVFKVGNLSTAGSLSKLNSPGLSSGVSPFSGSWTSVSGLECSLPGTSGFSKDNGAFLQGSYIQKKGVLRNLKASAYYDYENEKIFAGAFYGKFQINQDCKGEFSCTAGFFPYEEKKLTGWFNEEKYYSEGEHFCTNLQMSFTSKSYSGLFMSGAYENPFGKIQHLYRLENKISVKPFIFNISSFVNLYEDLITSSDKSAGCCIQFKGGIQYRFNSRLVVPFFWKTGINIYGKMNLMEDKQDLKAGIGVQGNSAVTSISLCAYINGTCDTEVLDNIRFKFSSASVQLKNYLYFKTFTVSVGENISVTPDSSWEVFTTEEKTSLNVNLDLFPDVTHSNSVTFSQKNGCFEKCHISTGITIKINLSTAFPVNCTVKISGAWNINREK